jgi:tRNA A-37 threonylcarbamoyl transferase component Bud32/tetratricopeptide (TPR) repeat protein
VRDLRDRVQAMLGPRYVVGPELEGGGMSRLFLADEVALGRRIVVKLLPPELAIDLDADRFRREIQVAAQLQHPHIVPVLTAGESDGLLYYTMPFVAGESLRERLTRGELPVADAVSILRDLAQALAYAHRSGVIHRDIKPGNVMLAEGGALIVDFGVAQALAGSHTDTVDTTGAPSIAGAIGTAAYMAPEQAVGDPTTDQRADLYALGVVAYETLIGAPPFAGRPPRELLAAHALEQPVPVNQRRPSVPPPLAALVMRCLEKRPADRPQSADEVLRALDATPVVAPRGRIVWRGVMVAVVIGLVATALSLGTRKATTVARRVLVVPFINATGDSSLDLVGLMAADWASNGIGQTRVIDVVDTRTAVLPRMAPGEQRNKAWADATGATIVVSGAYYRQRDSLWFRTAVTDAASGRVLQRVALVASPTADPLGGVRELADRITGALARSGDPRLRVIDPTSSEQPPTFTAYREFMAGNERWAHADFVGAIPHWHAAAMADSQFMTPVFMEAYGWYALRRPAAADSLARTLAQYRGDITPYERAWTDELLAAIRGDLYGRYQAIRAAAAADPSSELTRMKLAQDALAINRPHDAVVALDGLRPERNELSGVFDFWWNQADAYHRLGDHARELAVGDDAQRTAPGLRSAVVRIRALAAVGRIDDVQRVLDNAMAMPGDVKTTPDMAWYTAASELRAHGFAAGARAVIARAIQWYGELPESEGEHEWAQAGHARILYAAGQWAAADALFVRLAAAHPDNVEYRGYRGLVAARVGDRDAAEQVSAMLARVRQPYGYGKATLWRAKIAAVRGDTEQAMALLVEAAAQGQPIEPDFHADMDLESLRAYPPFRSWAAPRS